MKGVWGSSDFVCAFGTITKSRIRDILQIKIWRISGESPSVHCFAAPGEFAGAKIQLDRKNYTIKKPRLFWARLLFYVRQHTIFLFWP